MKTSNPYEGFFEKAMSDGSPDKIASQQLRLGSEAQGLAFMGVAGAAREIKDLRLDPRFAEYTPEQIRQLKVSEDMQSRDKFSFVSAALCSPLFLFGIGAAFALFDDFRVAREAKLKNVLAGKDGTAPNGVKKNVKAETIEEKAAKEKAEAPKPRLTAEATKLLGLENQRRISRVSDVKRVTRKTSQDVVSDRVKQKLFTGVEKSWEERAAQRSLKNWIKSEMLLKKKQSLLDHMEKVRGGSDYASYAGLASRLESLDKALKRMGM